MSTAALRALVRASMPAGAELWPNGLGFDLDTERGQWSFCPRSSDGRWHASYTETGEPCAFLIGTGASPAAAALAADKTAEGVDEPAACGFARAALVGLGLVR